MPVKLSEKQELFSVAMFTIGSLSFGNGVESARTAGYSGSANVLTQRGHELVRNSKVIERKAEIQANTATSVRVDRDYLIRKTQEIVDSADNERNKISAISLLGDFIGAKRETAPNQERTNQLNRRMDSETRKLAQELAKCLTRKRIDSQVLEEK